MASPLLPIAAGVSAVGGLAGGLLEGSANRRLQRDLMDKQEAERIRAREAQLNLMRETMSPTMSNEQREYVNRLMTEARDVGPLSQNRYVQGARSQLLGGGARALAGVTNRQRASGVSGGGFSNIGSIQDIQDRMSEALAGLSERAEADKLRKMQEAQGLQQNWLDRYQQWQNARQQALAAIESGDLASAIQGIQQAQALASQQSAQKQQMFGGLLSMGGALGGRATEISELERMRRENPELFTR